VAFGSVLLILALLILVALFIARPLVSGERAAWTGDSEHSHWLAERERVLEALAELDFDHQLDKVPEEIYLEQRQRLLGLGAIALKKLDALEDEKAEKRVEPTGESRKKPVKDSDLEAMIAAHKARRRR
jgi:hypothetical protein